MKARYELDTLLRLSGEDLTSLAEKLDVKRNTVEAWRRRGLSFDQADRAAVAVGWVAVNVWPEIEQEWPEVERVCPCGTRYLPTGTYQVWCTVPCGARHRSKAWRRNKRATDPEWAEARREERRVYWREMSPAARRAAARKRTESAVNG